MTNEFYWLWFFVPTVTKNLLIFLGFLRLHPKIHQLFFLTETISIIIFFIHIGVLIGKKLSDEKKDRLEELRKEQILELRIMQNSFMNQYDPLREQVQNMQTKLGKAEITISYFRKLYNDERVRHEVLIKKTTTAEQVNERAIQSLT